MRRISSLLLVCLALPATAHAKSDVFEYIDILSGEGTGELRTQRYDMNVHDGFLGTTAIGGTFIGGGIGLRPVYRFSHGVRFTYEASGQWGRLRDGGSAFDFATATRAEFLTGVGWETTLARVLVLHTATMIGLDAVWVDAVPKSALDAVNAGSGGARPSSLSLSRVDLRLGQQLGAHVQLANWIALYADGTIDYDGQWRARAGIAIGRPLR